ncbi:MAG: tryptophan 7-halogenase [Chroococcidiopsidaceae cyanobacterium CP_BM_ER_R8_30]|nr:tryptophan 7-halogenase [Chroococcidiopsidaceae cyanobacterium CP_BM_ER_R8_30]
MKSSVENDVIIVGGGPAGSTVGALLAMKNRRVLLLESEKFPRYHIGESLVPGVLPVLDELQVLDKVRAHGFIQKNGITFVWGKNSETWTIRFDEKSPAAKKYGSTFQVIRSEFDNLLLRHAESQGVDVREEHKVIDVIFEGDRCNGVKYINSQGEVKEARASYVVDASGQAAVLGKYFDIVDYDPRLKSVATWAYFKGVAPEIEERRGNILVESTPYGWLWVIPQHNERTSVGWVAWATKYKELLDGSIATTFAKVLASSSEAHRRLEEAQQDSEIYSTRDWSYRCRQLTGPGFLMVGDAAGFVDPLFSTGVWLATKAASLGAQIINELLENPAREQECMTFYEASYQHFLGQILDFVRYFYDSSRTQKEYFYKAQGILDSEKKDTARSDFIQLISGVSGLHRFLESGGNAPIGVEYQKG